MLKNHNDNIINRFFKVMAAFWNSAAEYQFFVILAAMALLAILPLFTVKLNDAANVVLNITIFCVAAVAGFLLLRLKGSHLAAFTFAAALLLRLSLVFVLESSTPYMLEGIRIRTNPWINHYDTTLFQPDEYFYFYQGQKYKDVTTREFINSPQLKKHAYRASFLMSRLFRFFGEQSFWPRVVGAFLGAFAAAFICLAAQNLFSKETAAIVSLICVIAPQTAFYSVSFLKEIWVILAMSIIVFGFVMIIRNKKPITSILSITTAIAILMWIRFEYGLIFITAIPIAICFRHKNNLVGKTAAVLSMILLSAIIFSYQFNKLIYKAEELLDARTIIKQGEQLGKLEAMDKIYKSRGPLRILNIPLVLLNLPPKNLHHIYSEENKLYDIVRLADIYQWWIPLPFLIIGAIVIFIKRTEFLAFLLPYIVGTSIAALLLGGLQGDTIRYRDSLAPVAFIIIGTGIESFMASPKGWKNRIITAVYIVFVLLAVYFYIRAF